MKRRQLKIAAVFTMTLIGFCRISNSQETVLTDNVRVKTATDPKVFLEETGVQTYSVLANGGGFSINDETANTSPFLIQPGAPTDAFTIGPDGRIGFKTGPNPSADLHIYKPFAQDAYIRLEAAGNQTTIDREAWDLVSGSILNTDVRGFSIGRLSAGFKVPFAIESGTPDNTLYLSQTGSIGVGTFTPNLIVTKSVTGKAFNVLSSDNHSQLAVQGAFSGALNLVHLNSPINQKNLRVRVRSGVATFDVVKDDYSGLTVANAITIGMATGYIGLKTTPDATKPLKLASGAHVTAGGVWTNASSRNLKEDIQPLSLEQAQATVAALQPVDYRYKSEPDERYVGFIAEDVPDLVATRDRQGLGSMDIVAVLTKVVQNQNEQLTQQRKMIAEQQAALTALARRLDEIESSKAP